MAFSVYMYLCVCVYALMDVSFVCVCPVILWMSWKFTTQVFTVSPGQKL